MAVSGTHKSALANRLEDLFILACVQRPGWIWPISARGRLKMFRDELNDLCETIPEARDKIEARISALQSLI